MKRLRKNAAVVTSQRVGALTPEEFERIGREVLGGRGWQKLLADATGWYPSTITRYIQGRLPVPQHVAILMEALTTLRRHGLPLPEAFTQVRGDGAGDLAGDGSDGIN